MPTHQSFKENQRQHVRVAEAYRDKEITLKKYFNHKNLNNTGYHLFIRAFKSEGILEVWVRPKNCDQFDHLIDYPFCSSSGVLGPKRKEGDLQIPEGVYHISHFNPQSKFYLSLAINYPNQSDLIFSDKESPGGEIYIHGNCVTVGCIPISDDKIKELYVLAVEARNNGQEKIPVHIFPTRMSDEKYAALRKAFSEKEQLLKFWENLQPIYASFESTKTVVEVQINGKGEYCNPP